MNAESTSTVWPGGMRGAVSLAFDDGMHSQLQLAIPLLGEYDLTATFYLNPPRDGDESAWRERLTPWRAAALQGHEIGNHSLTHLCSQNFDFVARGLESMTLVASAAGRLK
jgi:peptidoglycan/xylan/chitin deacetylase (PgdA/CDA1 family)